MPQLSRARDHIRKLAGRHGSAVWIAFQNISFFSGSVEALARARPDR